MHDQKQATWDRWFQRLLVMVALAFLLAIALSPLWRKEPIRISPSAYTLGG